MLSMCGFHQEIIQFVLSPFRILDKLLDKAYLAILAYENAIETLNFDFVQKEKLFWFIKMHQMMEVIVKSNFFTHITYSYFWLKYRNLCICVCFFKCDISINICLGLCWSQMLRCWLAVNKFPCVKWIWIKWAFRYLLLRKNINFNNFQKF